MTYSALALCMAPSSQDGMTTAILLPRQCS
jgi:hypothetical protein